MEFAGILKLNKIGNVKAEKKNFLIFFTFKIVSMVTLSLSLEIEL